jgi:hypothetical protein
MSAGKKLFKSRKGELRLSVFDLMRQYFMLTFSYNLRNFGAGKKSL